MQAGELNKKIRVLRDVDVPDAGGGYATTRVPTHVADFVWAKVTPGKPREALVDDAMRVVEEITITVRRGLDIVESDLVEFKGSLFNVRGIPTFDDTDLFFSFTVERGVNV